MRTPKKNAACMEIEQRREKHQAGTCEAFDRAYLHNNRIRMPEWQRRAMTTFMSSLTGCSTVLDVGCGRGESRHVADDSMCASVGFSAGRWHGCEVTPFACPRALRMELVPGVHDLSVYHDNAFDLVTVNDVFSFVHEQDVPRGLEEVFRVASKHVYITICSAQLTLSDYPVLPVTVREPDWWEKQIKDALKARGYDQRKVKRVGADAPEKWQPFTAFHVELRATGE